MKVSFQNDWSDIWGTGDQDCEDHDVGGSYWPAYWTYRTSWSHVAPDDAGWHSSQQSNQSSLSLRPDPSWTNQNPCFQTQQLIGRPEVFQVMRFCLISLSVNRIRPLIWPPGHGHEDATTTQWDKLRLNTGHVFSWENWTWLQTRVQVGKSQQLEK